MARDSDDRLTALVAFAGVARRLSFAEAARDQGVHPSILSRRIARLEERLGVRLLQRTTRRVSLTEAGATYLEQVQDVLGRLDDADAAVSGLGQAPRGRLRVALPNLFGQKHVAPLLPAFHARYPELLMELMFSDRFVDLVEEKIDVAVRMGTLAEGESDQLIARRLAPNRRLLMAAPEYLARAGTPRTPEDLAGHAALHFSLFIGGDAWQLRRGERSVRVKIDPVIRADNGEALRHATLGGCGIALLGTFLAGDDLRAGRLIHVLPEWSLPDSAIWAVYPSARFLPQKVRVLIDYLVAAFSGVPPWDSGLPRD
jgi:DNA-binding transcriptional LysR family regulator